MDLEKFLDELPAEAAANARAAAARIDELEHAASRIGRSDRTYLLVFGAAGLLALGAVAILMVASISYGSRAPDLRGILMLMMAGAFPAIVIIYSLKMKERTKLDRQKFEIIETYFLPYDAIYLPPGPEREKGIVSIAERKGGWRRKPEDEAKVKKPGWYW